MTRDTVRPASWWDHMYRDGEYLRRWDSRVPSPELVALVAAGVIPRGGRTLEVGCGAGTDAVFLARCGFQSAAIDVSEAAVGIARERARKAGVDVDFRSSDALDLPFGEREFDFASDRVCFHHIPERDRGRYASELARVVKPGGLVLIRGARHTSDDDPEDAPFIALSEESIDRAFCSPMFSRGPVLPIMLTSDSGALQMLEANMVVLHRR